MSIYSKFKTDPNAESGEGITLDYGTAGKLFIRRAGGGNKLYQELMQKRMKSYARRLHNGTMSEEEANKILIGVYADSVVIRSELVGEDGKVIKHTRENIVKVFNELPDLFRDVVEAATDRELFVEQQVEADKGN